MSMRLVALDSRPEDPSERKIPLLPLHKVDTNFVFPDKALEFSKILELVDASTTVLLV